MNNASGGSDGSSEHASGHAETPPTVSDCVTATQLWRAALGQHRQEISAATARLGVSKLIHYLATSLGVQRPPAEEYLPPPRRHAAAGAVAHSHWLTEETAQ